MPSYVSSKRSSVATFVAQDGSETYKPDRFKNRTRKALKNKNHRGKTVKHEQNDNNSMYSTPNLTRDPTWLVNRDEIEACQTFETRQDILDAPLPMERDETTLKAPSKRDDISGSFTDDDIDDDDDDDGLESTMSDAPSHRTGITSETIVPDTLLRSRQLSKARQMRRERRKVAASSVKEQGASRSSKAPILERIRNSHSIISVASSASNMGSVSENGLNNLEHEYATITETREELTAPEVEKSESTRTSIANAASENALVARELADETKADKNNDDDADNGNPKHRSREGATNDDGDINEDEQFEIVLDDGNEPLDTISPNDRSSHNAIVWKKPEVETPVKKQQDDGQEASPVSMKPPLPPKTKSKARPWYKKLFSPKSHKKHPRAHSQARTEYASSEKETIVPMAATAAAAAIGTTSAGLLAVSVFSTDSQGHTNPANGAHRAESGPSNPNAAAAAAVAREDNGTPNPVIDKPWGSYSNNYQSKISKHSKSVARKSESPSSVRARSIANDPSMNSASAASVQSSACSDSLSTDQPSQSFSEYSEGMRGSFSTAASASVYTYSTQTTAGGEDGQHDDGNDSDDDDDETAGEYDDETTEAYDTDDCSRQTESVCTGLSRPSKSRSIITKTTRESSRSVVSECTMQTNEEDEDDDNSDDDDEYSMSSSRVSRGSAYTDRSRKTSSKRSIAASNNAIDSLNVVRSADGETSKSQATSTGITALGDASKSTTAVGSEDNGMHKPKSSGEEEGATGGSTLVANGTMDASTIKSMRTADSSKGVSSWRTKFRKSARRMMSSRSMASANGDHAITLQNPSILSVTSNDIVPASTSRSMKIKIADEQTIMSGLTSPTMLQSRTMKSLTSGMQRSPTSLRNETDIIEEAEAENTDADDDDDESAKKDSPSNLATMMDHNSQSKSFETNMSDNCTDAASVGTNQTDSIFHWPTFSSPTSWLVTSQPEQDDNDQSVSPVAE